ncbi:MFS transporter [Actinobacteria bacterium YIM 96077]|uniref:Lysosomal dipeptide transporter MFSD1 n=1 Tax=Phytoactinopolyspora halophila TaxID=1981511 RepID=A0A329R0G5_9ACTN|nr:MFS transporter [Phytoactinopolyspora halophila]AYY11509.1 MFS transporter [Actinobacteria bacterium YIM 96077]RAW18007.1 MFS transporter [Phytoactinopolyspora halophila]
MSTSRRAWTVWGVGLVAYIVAVLHRTSFGVSGLAAAERFGTTASVLASFVVVQLLVYAGLQVPVGILLDQIGPRRLLIIGAVVMALGQLVLAVAASVQVAMGGRVLVGAGDAMTFVSVLRLVAAWFPPGRVPLLTQLTGLIGQLGQVLSAVPFVLVLDMWGWTPAFGSVASVSVFIAVLAIALLRDSPDVRTRPVQRITWAGVGSDLLKAWQHPGTRLGLWTHFSTGFSGMVFAMMWGFPFLVAGQGLSEGTAGSLLTLMVLAGAAAGPVVGVLVQRHPLRRSWLVLGVVLANASAWTAVLAWPGEAPLWLLVLLILSLSLSGPGSMIGFDFARTFNPPNRLGTATGMVNVGGFTAALVTILAIGLVIDIRTGGASTYGLDDLRVALCLHYVIWLTGLIGILRTRRLVRRRMAAHGVVVPPIREVIERRRRNRRWRS